MRREIMRRELVSVVVPAFDYARFLPQALDGALAQADELQRSGLGLEVVVVDDGSTDDTPAVLERYAGRIKAVRQPNAGLPAARNAGLAMAQGSLVVFLDADDVLLPGVLASQANVLKAHPGAAASVCRSLFFEQCDQRGAPAPCGEWRLFRHDLAAHLCHFNVAPPHAVMARREAVDRIGGFDTALGACEDHDFWFRLSCLGGDFLPNLEAAVAYRRHPASMSRNLERQHGHDAILHQRIADALLGENHMAGARLEGLLACLAGCLLTASRLEVARPQAAQGLAQRASELLAALEAEAPRPALAPATSAYFGLRVRCGLLQYPWLARACGADAQHVLSRLPPEAAPASLDAVEAALERLAAELY